MDGWILVVQRYTVVITPINRIGTSVEKKTHFLTHTHTKKMNKNSEPPTSKVFLGVGLWAGIPPDSLDQPTNQTTALEH